LKIALSSSKHARRRVMAQSNATTIDTKKSDPDPKRQHWVDGFIYIRIAAGSANSTGVAGIKSLMDVVPLQEPDAILAIYIRKGCLGKASREDPSHVYVTNSRVICPIYLLKSANELAVMTHVWVFSAETAQGEPKSNMEIPNAFRGITGNRAGEAPIFTEDHCKGADDTLEFKQDPLSRFMREEVLPIYLNSLTSTEGVRRLILDLVTQRAQSLDVTPDLIDADPTAPPTLVTFTLSNVGAWQCEYLTSLSKVSNHIHATDC
jgi:hypothetical protein